MAHDIAALVEAIGGMLAQGIEPNTISVEFPGLDVSILEWIDRFKAEGEAAVIMRIARQARIPYSEAVHRWRDPEDRARELAWDIIEAERSARSCPNCGTDPHDILDEDFNELENGRLKVERRGCHMCSIVNRVEREISAEHRDEFGSHVVIVPRMPGEPIADY